MSSSVCCTEQTSCYLASQFTEIENNNTTAKSNAYAVAKPTPIETKTSSAPSSTTMDDYIHRLPNGCITLLLSNVPSYLTEDELFEAVWTFSGIKTRPFFVCCGAYRLTLVGCGSYQDASTVITSINDKLVLPKSKNAVQTSYFFDAFSPKAIEMLLGNSPIAQRGENEARAAELYEGKTAEGTYSDTKRMEVNQRPENEASDEANVTRLKTKLQTPTKRPPSLIYSGRRGDRQPNGNKICQSAPTSKHPGPLGWTVLVYYIPPLWTERDLYDHFQPFGEILSARIRRDATGRNYGSVSFSTKLSARDAIEHMDWFHAAPRKWLRVCGMRHH